MGLFSRKKKGPVIVLVAFRELTRPGPDNADHAYPYVWTLEEPPMPGMRVIVPGSGGLAPAIVVEVGSNDKARSGDLKAVKRLVTADEVAAAHAKDAADLDAWFRMARKAAGLPGAGRVRTTPPGDYPAIPPADGEATAKAAGEYGRVWYSLWKRAEEAQRPDDEVRAFRSIAHRWYAIRDRK